MPRRPDLIGVNAIGAPVAEAAGMEGRIAPSASVAAAIARARAMIELDFWGFMSSPAIVEAIDAAGIDLGLLAAPASGGQPSPGCGDCAS